MHATKPELSVNTPISLKCDAYPKCCTAAADSRVLEANLLCRDSLFIDCGKTVTPYRVPSQSSLPASKLPLSSHSGEQGVARLKC